MGIAMMTAGVAGVLLGMTFTFYPTRVPSTSSLLLAWWSLATGSMKGPWRGLILAVAQLLGAQVFGRVPAVLRLCGSARRVSVKTARDIRQGVKKPVLRHRAFSRKVLMNKIMDKIRWPFLGSSCSRWQRFLSGEPNTSFFSVSCSACISPLSQMWNLLAGYSGLISLGQQSFIGLGGYTVAVFCNYYQVSLWLSILIGGVVSCLAGLCSCPFLYSG